MGRRGIKKGGGEGGKEGVERGWREERRGEVIVF